MYAKVMQPISTIRPTIKKALDIRPAGQRALFGDVWRPEEQHNDPPHLMDCNMLLRCMRDYNFAGPRPENAADRDAWTKKNEAIRDLYYEEAMRIFFISVWRSGG